MSTTHIATGEFTVKAARNAGTKPNPHGGTFVKWYVDLLDANGEPVKDSSGKVSDAYWQRKEGSEVTAGDTVYGTITEGEFGLRFKMEQRPDSAPSGGSSGGSKGGREFKPESQFDPEKTARIGRAHAQHMAILTLDAMGLFESLSATQIESKIKGWTDFYSKDVNAAGEAAKQASGNATPGGTERAASSPASASSTPASQPPNPSYEEIEQALDTAGLTVTPARQKVAEFMVTQLAAERVIKAVNNLVGSDLELQGTTLKALRENTETWTGGPLPDELAPGDEPPF